jgi:serine/threonine protein kinase
LSITVRRLAQYELLNQLGKGNVGQVWKARDLSFHRDVAVKIFHPDLQRSEAYFLTRLTNEGQALLTLRHPNIVPVHEIKVARLTQSQETIAYLVMDYISGHTLADYLRLTVGKYFFPPFTDIIYLLTSLSTAIDFAHQRGIVHGNIKPSNILLNRHNTSQFKVGEPLLTDLGLAQFRGIVKNSNPLYISPEQAQGLPANNRSDVYTLGVLLYELCTGTVPFHDEDPVTVRTQHIHRLPTPPMLINPNIPPALSEVILRAMAKDPFMRFSKASLLAAAVAETSSLQPKFYIGRQLPPDNGNLLNTPPLISSNTSPKIPSILGVIQPHPQELPSKPLIVEPIQSPRNIQNFVPHLSSPPSSQTSPLPTALGELAKPSRPEQALLPDTEKQRAIPQPVHATKSENSFQFKSLPLLPTKPSTSMTPTIPSSQFTARSQPSINTTTTPRITAPQFAIRTSQLTQTGYSKGGYNLQIKPKQFVSFIPAQTPPPSQETQAHLLYKKAPEYIIFASLLVAALMFNSAIGISLLVNKSQSSSTIHRSGRIFFQDDAFGQNDQLRVDLQNVVVQPNGKSYFAWLQDTTGYIRPLGPLTIQNGQILFIYPGDTMHHNLLGTMQGLFITTRDQGSKPQPPDKHNKVYQASFDTDTLASLKNILYQTPGLPNNGSITSEILDTIWSINDKAGSIHDSLNHDSALVLRQAARIIDLLDGSAYAAQSGDLPSTVVSGINAPIGLLSSPKQVGYLDILDQQLQQLKRISQHNPDRLQHIQHIENAIQDLHGWLENLRTYDVQILKATNLSDPAILSSSLQLKQVAVDCYVGHTIPPNIAPQPVLGSAGASQAYIEAQYLATLDFTRVA